MKSLALLVFVFLVMPGSGRMVWDGLPLSTRAEFAALVVLVLGMFNQRVRATVRDLLDRWKWRGAVKPFLGLLLLAKLLTFAWYPFSDGFSACYRSLYYPLPDTEECEKSYESPFVRNGFVIDNASRTERTVDFGTHLHDWSLPFMNEYPRLGALWLQRFPFTARFGAVVENEATTPRYLPVYGNGEISGSLGSVAFSTAEVALVDRYEFPRITLIEVPAEFSEFKLDYRFSDDDATEPPDVAPPARGPYAVLKVGEPQSRAELLKSIQVRIRGWAVDTTADRTPDHVVARDASGTEVGRSEPQARPDVAEYVGNPELTMGGFNFVVPAAAIESGDVTIEAVYGDRSTVLGQLRKTADYVPAPPTFALSATEGLQSDFSVWFDADRDDITALAPQTHRDMPLTFDSLVFLLDIISAVIVGGLLLGLLRAWGRSLAPALGLAAAAFGLTAMGEEIAPNVFGTRLFLPLVVMTILLVLVMRQTNSMTIVTFLPMAVVLAAYKTFDHLERYHAGKGDRWWGRLLFYGRDSDWYATQGYARTVFLENSLRGGESLFWFQAGPRYLALATRSLLGENDVLVGVIMTALGFFGVLVIVTRFLATHRRVPALVIGSLVLLTLLFFMSDDLMATFGLVGSSEYPTWTMLFLVTGFVVSTRCESRTWLLVTMSFALGYSIQLRPNQIGGVVLLFVALLLIVDRADKEQAVSVIGKMTVTFVAVTLFSLWHNLHYGESFVPFTANAGINYAFSWRDVLGLDPGEATWSNVWDQARYMMYWNPAGNWAWALAFWGSQLLWLGLVAARIRCGIALHARSLLLLIPFGYALPMLKYQMGSYYPRHLVVINLSFMCAALMAWPRSDEVAERNTSVAVPDGLPGSDDATPVVAQAPEVAVSAESR